MEHECKLCNCATELAAARAENRALRELLIGFEDGTFRVGGEGEWIGRYATREIAEAALDAAVKANVSETTHPPVLPVGELFVERAGKWYFLFSGCHDLDALTWEETPRLIRRIISAVQFYAWIKEGHRLSRLAAANAGTAAEEGNISEMVAANEYTAAWEKWGKE